MGFLIPLRPLRSNRVLMRPSMIPICDPNPSMSNMEKNRQLQNGAQGNIVKTSAMTMNAKPVPWPAFSNSASIEQFCKDRPAKKHLTINKFTEQINPLRNDNIFRWCYTKLFLPNKFIQRKLWKFFQMFHNWWATMWYKHKYNFYFFYLRNLHFLNSLVLYRSHLWYWSILMPSWGLLPILKEYR